MVMPTPWVTYALIAFLGVIFVIEMALGSAATPTLAHMGANIVARTRAGEIDRLLAASTLHVAPWHALMNLYVLYALGRQMEPLFGHRRFAVLYFASAIGGGIGTTLLGGVGASAGASGAIWGLLGASAVLAFRPPSHWSPQMVQAARRGAMINLLINVGISFMPGIDRWAHFGGGVVGALLVLLGILTPPRWLAAKGRTETPAHATSLSIVAVILMLLTLVSVGVAWERGRPWALMDPPVLTRRTLVAEGISIEIPEELGESSAAARTYGDLGIDRFAVQLMGVDTNHGPTPEIEAAQIASELGSREPTDAASMGPSVRVDLPSGPAAMRTYRVGEGLVLVRIIVVGPERTAALDVLGWGAYGDIPELARNVAGSIAW